jgi:hypothetical protein
VNPVETMLDALERAGGGPKQSGTSWSARCPAHEDQNASLSVSEGHDGRVLVKCHAGCTLEAILAVLELKLADLFPVAKTNGSGMEIAATYDYTDESGELSYQVVRLAPKSFRQRRPNGRGGWTWKLGNATRVPFHLPNLIAGVTEGKWIFVAEGEKDVLRLEGAGFVATSNSGGAGKFLPAFAPYFKGARVAILPDNDETGRAHAEQVALILAPTAAEVRVVELPRLAEHGDVSDFLNNGGSAVELKALLLEAQTWQPPRNKIVPLRVIAEDVDDDAEVDSGWEDPTPLPATRDATPFCSGVLGPVATEFTEAVAAETATPVDLAVIAALGTVSTVIAGAVVVEPYDGWREPVNLYLNCLAAPGEGKTPVMTKTTRVLDLIERERRDRLRPEIIEAESRKRMAADRLKRSETAVAKAPQEKRDEAEQDALEAARDEASIAVPSLPRLYTRDATPEALVKLLAEQNGRLGFVTDEASEFFQLAARYSATGKGNLGIYVDGFDGKRHVSDRVGREPLVIEHVTLTVCLLGQPIVLEDLGRDRQANGRGLLARFLWSLPGSKVGWRPIHRQSVPEQVLEAWEKLIIDLASQAEAAIEPIVLRLSAQAKHLWDAWREELEPRLRRELGDLSTIVEWAAKLPGQTLRLAGNLHALRTGRLGGTIDAETMKAALELADYFADHALVVFAKMRADPRLDDASHVLDWLKARRPSVVTTRAVTRSKSWDAERARKAFELLADYGWVRPSQASGGLGRPSERWATHPDLS